LRSKLAASRDQHVLAELVLLQSMSWEMGISVGRVVASCAGVWHAHLRLNLAGPLVHILVW
jgi:hypothetical protein